MVRYSYPDLGKEKHFILPMARLELPSKVYRRDTCQSRMTAEGCLLAFPPTVVEISLSVLRRSLEDPTSTAHTVFFCLHLSVCSFGFGVDVIEQKLYLLHYGGKPVI